jgi:hypothetical protein
MSAEFAVGLGCFVLAFGHTTVGVRWVLPGLAEARLPGTPFGPPSLTLAMLRFTWHVVTVMLLGFGILFMTLALAPDADPETLLLRWFAALWLAATAMAFWQVRRRPRSLLRFPVPLLFVALAVLSWAAST